MFKKILIINPFGIGDVLFTTPLLRALKEANPTVRISYWCNERVEPVLRNNPHLEKIFALSRGDIKRLTQESRVLGIKKLLRLLAQLKKEHFDLCFDFSLDYRYGLMSALIGIPKRIGYNYKNRGRFLSHKKDIDGYNVQHIVEYYLGLLEFVGVRPKFNDLELFVSQAGRTKAEVLLGSFGAREGGLLIGIAAGAGLSWGKHAYLKHWPAGNFAKVADQLSENNRVKIVLLGDGLERDIADKIVHTMRHKPIDLVGKLRLGDYIDLLSRLDMLITNDGGPLHMAVALGLKTVSIFGPVDEKVYGPYPLSDKHIVIKKSLACRPCYKSFRLKPCSNERACIEEISVDEVYRAAQQLINR